MSSLVGEKIARSACLPEEVLLAYIVPYVDGGVLGRFRSTSKRFKTLRDTEWNVKRIIHAEKMVTYYSKVYGDEDVNKALRQICFDNGVLLDRGVDPGDVEDSEERRIAQRRSANEKVATLLRCAQAGSRVTEGLNLNMSGYLKGSWRKGPPLQLAACSGQKAVIELLLSHGADVAKSTTSDGTNALHRASILGHGDVVELFLNRALVDVNAQNRYRNTALHYATVEGQTDVVQLLLKQTNIDVNAKNKFGKTPIHCAALLGHAKEVALLMGISSIELDAEDVDGKTPLDWAFANDHRAVVDLLSAGLPGDLAPL